MPIFKKTIEAIRSAEKYSEKSAILRALLQNFSHKKIKLSPETQSEISDFIFGEIERLLVLIPCAQTYKEKDFLFEYEDCLLGAIMACYSSSADVPQDKLSKANLLISMVEKERFLEVMVDDIFTKHNHDPENIKYLISMTGLAKEEYHKGKLYQGLLHYQRDIWHLPSESRDILGAHIASEMNRYLENPLSAETESNLELICDVCRYFRKELFVDALNKSLWIGNQHIRFYAVATLLTFGCEAPMSIIESLAGDMEYANLTYLLLKQYHLEKFFPAECSTPEYLAQSDLVRWLNYPTELGKSPDEIEYLGKVRKGEKFYIFRFRSDSENLSPDVRGQWLIGWSGSKGGTFSTFDLYSDYKQLTNDKTVKYIKKKLL
jgi:hypothetical protein